MVCNAFMNVARGTWRINEQSHNVGYQIGEETITDLVLLHLKKNCRSSVTVMEYTKPFEGTTSGADWLFEFVDRANNKSYGVLVQAKRLDTTSLTYKDLAYRSKRGVVQHTKLTTYASTIGAYPSYVFYNYVEPAGVHNINYNCGNWCPSRDIELYGCSFADAIAIRSEISRNRWFFPHPLSSISRMAAPWHCLVCCPTNNGNAPSLLDTVHSTARRLARHRIDSDQSVPAIRNGIPLYVTAALNAVDVRVDGQSIKPPEELRGNVGHLVVIEEPKDFSFREGRG